MSSGNPTDGPGLPAPVTAERQVLDEGTPSKWIRFGKGALLGFRGLTSCVAIATFISAIACAASKVDIHPSYFGLSIYSLLTNVIAILFTFRYQPFNPDGWIFRTLPGFVRSVRRWPGIPLSIIDIGAIALMTYSVMMDYGDSYERKVFQVTFGLASGCHAAHWATLCGGWLFGIITVLKACCSEQGRKDKVKRRKIEAMYEKARAEMKEKELEEQNRVVYSAEEGRNMTKKEKMEKAYEKARVEREMVEKMLREESEKESGVGTETTGAIPVVGTATAAGGLTEHFAPAVPAVEGKKWKDMTKKERLEAKYEQARLERETKGKGKERSRADEMV
ncbi:hypothetical protein BJ508DRAFT_415501 [Ascobolus immersus RN42]|uniref:Uncharacterized protein n=1 Tax=Ascobolus immersus RN42 TaxID=1160509 RepID=A0A3N4I2A1_ASCIM|nr:hypothetical protein BJ508DRAFT_415501 [Ascobolus immersus RN42]